MYHKVNLTKTNLQKYPPLLLNYICARAMQRAKKGQLKIPFLKKSTGLCPSRSYYPTYGWVIIRVVLENVYRTTLTHISSAKYKNCAKPLKFDNHGSKYCVCFVKKKDTKIWENESSTLGFIIMLSFSLGLCYFHQRDGITRCLTPIFSWK